MRLKYLFCAAVLAAGCTKKAEVAPEQACGTVAIVRLCLGNTMACRTEHTTLELADGTRLRPGGPLWDAYLTHQAGGQTLRIGYTPGEVLPNNEVGDMRATLTCLDETPPSFCGTR